MKFLKTGCFLLFAAISLMACSKNNSKPSVNGSMEGVWAGKFGTGNNSPSSFFSYNFKAGGVLEELTDNGQVKGTGVWKLENNILSGYTVNEMAPVGNKYSMLGAFNAAQGKILGNWGYGNSSTDGGLWEMSRKN